jgi:hypothetical protein
VTNYLGELVVKIRINQQKVVALAAAGPILPSSATATSLAPATDKSLQGRAADPVWQFKATSN